MKVLALDTSTQMATVALFDNDILIAQTGIDNPKTHSQKLMPILKNLMDAIGWDMSLIDVIGVGVGAGSFTGVRIAISVAKALAQPFNIPIFPISSLRAMCYSFSMFDGDICPMFDARRMQVYSSVYRCNDGNVNAIIPERCILVEDLLDEIKNSTQVSFAHKMLFMGDGARKFQHEIMDALGDRAVFVPISLMMPMAASIGMAVLSANKEEYKSYHDIEANYLRRPEAEVNWESQYVKSK